MIDDADLTGLIKFLSIAKSSRSREQKGESVVMGVAWQQFGERCSGIG